MNMQYDSSIHALYHWWCNSPFNQVYVFIFVQVPSGNDQLTDNSPFLLSASTLSQLKLLQSITKPGDLLFHVEGPHRLWLRKIKQHYFSLKLSKRDAKYHLSDEGTLCRDLSHWIALYCNYIRSVITVYVWYIQVQCWVCVCVIQPTRRVCRTGWELFSRTTRLSPRPPWSTTLGRQKLKRSNQLITVLRNYHRTELAYPVEKPMNRRSWLMHIVYVVVCDPI